MPAAPNTAALPNDPDPTPDQASAPASTRTGRLLGFVRELIDYGKHIAAVLQRRAITTVPFPLACRFGTRNAALILMRIVRAVQLATALEARLIRHPLREVSALPAAPRPPSERARRAAQPGESRARPARPPLPDMPTAEEIAAALRNRPVGEVLAQICNDLGIVPDHPLWDEIISAVVRFGGNLIKLVEDVTDRMSFWSTDPSALEEAGWAQPQPQAATGPP